MQTSKPLAPGWVYNLNDYRQMFDLTEGDLSQSILDYPAGISSFNAEMKAMGHAVVSGDQSYGLPPDEMRELADSIYHEDEVELRAHLDRLVDQSEAGVKTMLTNWQSRKEQFLLDYAKGQSENRYQNMTMPTLSSKDHEFELALCSDLLFQSQAREGYTPMTLLQELCRVAKEVRVFPLMDESGDVAKVLGPVMLELQSNNFGVEVRAVPYEEQKGSNAMLRVWATECVVE